MKQSNHIISVRDSNRGSTPRHTFQILIKGGYIYAYF
nr:MAG TPA: hypothetical protein [Bacteriophage sp.]